MRMSCPNTSSPQAFWTLWAFSIGALLFPIVLMFANRATVPLLVAIGVAAVVDRFRGVACKRVMDQWMLGALAVLPALSLLSTFWEYTPGLALGKTVQMAGLWVAGFFALAGVQGLGSQERKQIFFCGAAGFIFGTSLVFFEYFSGLVIAELLGKIPEEGALRANLSVYKSAGTVCAVFAFVLAGKAAREGRWGLAVAIPVCAVAMAEVTGSLTGLLAISAATASVIVGYFSRRTMAVLLTVGVASFFALSPFMSSVPSGRALYDLVPWAPNSAIHRVAIWQFAAEKIAERPIVGWGMEASRNIPGGDGVVETWVSNGSASPTRLPQQTMPLHPHNFALQIRLELGLLGVLSAMAIVFRSIFLSMKQPGYFALTCFSVLSACLIVASISFGIWQMWWLSCLWLFAAFLHIFFLTPQAEDG